MTAGRPAAALRGSAAAATVAAAVLVGVAVVALLGLHAACTTHVPPPVSGAPAPGSPRAAWCGAADTAGGRTLAAALCVAVAAGAGAAWRRRRPAAAGLAIVLAAGLLLAVFLVADGLDAGPPTGP